MKTTTQPKPFRRTDFDDIERYHWPAYLLATERRALERCCQLMHSLPYAGIDIGCGTGRWSLFMALRGWRMVGTDTDTEALEVCRQKMPECPFIPTSPNAVSLPIPTTPHRYNLAVCLEVAPVMEAAWLPGELQRLLASGGRFVGVHFNRHSWRGLAVQFKYWVKGDWRSKVYYTSSYSSWRAKMEAAGFEFEYQRGFCWMPFGRKSNSPLIPACVWLERVLGLRKLVRWSPWVIFIARKG